MTDETQPVAPVADTAPEAQPEATSAQTNTADLSTFLDEYEQTTKAVPPAPPPAPAAAAPVDEVTQLKGRLAEIERQNFVKREAEDKAKAIEKIKSGLPIDELTVRGFLDMKAETTPLINEIWANRDKNPRAAEKLIKGLHAELAAREAKRPDRNATEDRQAVAAAMRGGSSTTAPQEEAPNYGGMNDAEFQAAKAKLGLT